MLKRKHAPDDPTRCSRHHVGPLNCPLKPLRTSQHYRIEGFNGLPLVLRQNKHQNNKWKR